MNLRYRKLLIEHTEPNRFYLTKKNKTEPGG
jgi:hypothetical protein